MTEDIKKEVMETIRGLKNYRKPNTDENPIVIVGPAGNNSEDLRVYANGGAIGNISTRGNVDKGNAEAYSKYIKTKYTDGHGTEYSCPLWLTKAYRDRVDTVDGLSAYLLSFGDDKATNSPLRKMGYLDCMVAATENRMTHNKNNVEMYPGERKIQTRLIKQFMRKKYNESNMIVTDMEYHISLVSRKKQNGKIKNSCKPDFIVFNGTSFGFIELKYNGESMAARTDNSIREHYLDFKNILCEQSTENRREILQESMRRLEYLAEFELVDRESWHKTIQSCKESLEDKNPDDMLWSGFYFVGGDENKIRTEIKNQLNEFQENDRNIMTVKYCYVDEDFAKWNMNFVDLWNEIFS